MKPLARLLAIATGLALMLLMLHSTPSWSQPVCASPGCNSTASDVNENTAGGTDALANLSDGFSNTAFGTAALQSTTTGDQNTAIGSVALIKNTIGNQNTASGFQALFQNISGNSNTATGASALVDNTTGNQNTASGVFALSANTIGSNNTAIGASALGSNIEGIRNTAVGFAALAFSTGNKNIGIGYKAGEALTAGHNNIFIGNQGAGDESQTIRIGTAQTQTFIAGIGGASVNGDAVMVDTVTGRLGIVTSSARYKQDIAPMGTNSEGLLRLRPVTFAYKEDARHVKHYGLIAEEVAAVYPELVTHTATGEVQAVRYQELIPMLLNELQRQRQDFQRELAELRALVGQRRGTEASTCAAAGQTAASTH